MAWIDSLQAASEVSAVTANIAEVQKLASALGIGGTPSYIISNEIIPGAIGHDGLQAIVSAMRECGLTAC